VVLRADQATSEDITDAVSEVMTDVSYRDAARQMQTELRRLPSIGDIIPVLERLN
jgi:UDP:flavonoid glycosyltransferase YjiC (YdhE family)